MSHRAGERPLTPTSKGNTKKLYAAKSSALRAAKAAGLEQYEIIEQDGQFGFRPIEAEDASEGEALEAMEQERDEAQNPGAPEVQADEPQPEEAPATAT